MLKSGDLLMYVAKSSKDQAIANSYVPNIGQYCHVAIYLNDDWIVEAIPDEGVIKRKLEPNEMFEIYRCKYNLSSEDTNKLISTLNSLIGEQYNETYLKDDEGYYCSELIQYTYNQIRPNLINDIVMKFEDDSNYEWSELYGENNTPKQELGTHPASIIDNENFIKIN